MSETKTTSTGSVVEQSVVMKPVLYELINPSDPYTFYANSIEIAGVCAVLLSTGFGASPVHGEGESTPVLFGWNEWLADRGIDETWIEEHRNEIADAYDSFLIGSASQRTDVETMLALLDDDKKQQWRDGRQDRIRSSMSQIGEQAYEYAKRYRKGSS